MIEEIFWTLVMYGMLGLSHYATEGATDWIAYLYTYFLLMAIIITGLKKFEDWGVKRLEESDKKYWRNYNGI